MKRNYEYLLSDLSLLKGVGTKTSNLLKKKKVNTIFDLLWKLPKSYTDRSLSSKIKDLKIDEIQTITIIPLKYSFPRVRNLPNRVLCKDDTGEIEQIKKKIIYRSNYRGTKEMDKLLGAFTRKYLDQLNGEDLHQLIKLLEIDDNNLYNFYNGLNTDLQFEDNKINNLFKNFKY